MQNVLDLFKSAAYVLFIRKRSGGLSVLSSGSTDLGSQNLNLKVGNPGLKGLASELRGRIEIWIAAETAPL